MPACGGRLEGRQEGSCQGLYCKACDTWAVVTTYFPPIFHDPETYLLEVVSGDFRNEQHLRAIAVLMNVNFLAARKMLQSGETMIVKGNVREIQPARDSLTAVEGLIFRITPDFSW